MRILFVTICGYLLDLLLGDPTVLTPVHPVVLMGRTISALEARLRSLFPATARGEFCGGLILAAMLPLGTFLFSFFLLTLLYRVLAPAAFCLEIIWCWQALAVKDLRVEAMRVRDALCNGSLAQARQAVSRIVGRDTDTLDAAAVTRAAVETVAENFSDGVIAPMLCMLLGGAPFALCYKAINTMDSMIGYKTPRYLYFGRAAARLDDAANWLPSRLAALLLIGAAVLGGEDYSSAFRIWRRDRRKHPSPNSAQCEAAMAGALGLRLCGPASYFGRLCDKPAIGDDSRPIEADDIRRSCRMVYIGSALGLLIMGLLRFCVVRL